MGERGWMTNEKLKKFNEEAERRIKAAPPPDTVFQELESEEPEPGLELEFKAQHFCMETGMECGTAGAKIEDLLNDGWQIDDKIICPPFVIIIFSRVKEIKKNV